MYTLNYGDLRDNKNCNKKHVYYNPYTCEFSLSMGNIYIKLDNNIDSSHFIGQFNNLKSLIITP